MSGPKASNLWKWDLSSFAKINVQTYINITHEGRIRLRMLLMGHLIFMISDSVGRVQLRLQFQKQ
jgi:hypothetical protein